MRDIRRSLLRGPPFRHRQHPRMSGSVRLMPVASSVLIDHFVAGDMQHHAAALGLLRLGARDEHANTHRREKRDLRKVYDDTPPFADPVSAANSDAICSLPAVSRRPDRKMRRNPHSRLRTGWPLRPRGGKKRTGLRCYCYRKLQRRRIDWHVVRVRCPTFLTQRIDLQCPVREGTTAGSGCLLPDGAGPQFGSSRPTAVIAHCAP